jgi:Na+/phosphate symporter
LIIILIPLLIALVGLLMYAFSANPKLVEVGRILFFCGMFWVVYALMGHKLSL